MQKLIKKIWGVLTLLFCSSKNIYSVREKEEGDIFFFSFFPAVHFSVSLHINQAPLLFRHSEVGGDPHIQKQNFMTFHYPMGEFVGIGKQPKILCIHFYLTFFALLDQRPRSDSLLWFLMHHPISSTLSQFFSRVDPFPVFPSALLSKQLLPAIY